VKLVPEFRQLSEEDVAAIVELGREQVTLMRELEAALLAGDEPRALAIARAMVGLEQRIRS
jgi:hypothetical protein